MATTTSLEGEPRRHGPDVVEVPRRPARTDHAAPARTLLDVFAATVARCGERTAIDAPDATLTYRQFARVADRLAARLRELGIGPGDRVGVRVPSGRAELYVAILGVLTAGAAYVPADADDPPGRAERLFERARACAVVEEGLEVRRLGPPRGIRRPLTPADEAWVIFTSGSTGAPKGVAVSHRSAAAFVDAEARLWAVDLDDRVLAGLSVGFDASCEEMWLAWRHGAALVPAPRALVRSGADLGEWIVDCEITIVSTVPTLAAMWDPDALAGVRLLILGGEACPERLGWTLAADREVWNTYGPTEATVVSTAAPIRPGRPVTIGWPLSGWQVAVLDEDGVPVALGQEGELVIAGAGLGRYLDEELDAQRFAPVPELGWDRAYRTGDIVRETPAGIEFVGRRDHQIKIAGRRIELGEIDALVGAAPGVSSAVTVARETDAGNKVLVSYVVGSATPDAVRRYVSERAAAGLVPMIVPIDELPQATSGKVDRSALPWPPPAPAQDGPATGTAAWLAGLWRGQLGPVPIANDSDFFELGGSSLAAAKLVSELRSRFPSVAVADIYNHRRLGALSERLEQLGQIEHSSRPVSRRPVRRWQAVQLAGVLALVMLAAPQWLLGVLAFNAWQRGPAGPIVSWAWLVPAWLLFSTTPGRALVMTLARRVLLAGVEPGRYPKRGWVSSRVWFLERLSELLHLERLAGTPWAGRFARMCGHRVDPSARLGTLPPAAGLATVEAGATLESDVDMHGWWIEGDELVIGEVRIGRDARIGTRALLMPGSRVGAGAEVEPGSVVSGAVPDGERWAGAPAVRVGCAGEHWPAEPPPGGGSRAWKAMFALGLMLENLLPLLAALPGIALLLAFGPQHWTPAAVVSRMVVLAPVLTVSFVLAYSAVLAIVLRGLWRLIRPGWHNEQSGAGWALWLSGGLVTGAHDALFPLFASVYTRGWLRLIGIPVGRGSEISTTVGINPLTRVGERSFAADDVMLACGRARAGWLHVAPIDVGDGSFLGNGAILMGGTTVAERSLVGLLTVAPPAGRPGSSWLGAPALELPRRPTPADPARTTDPPRRLVVGRGLAELVRILFPGSVSVVLAALTFWGLDAIGTSSGLWLMVVAAPVVLIGAGLVAALITAAVKWLLIGRYRVGDHPLWSWFVWRDEIINSCQEQLAGLWLLNVALATPLMSAYLRLMGAHIGRDAWIETLTITEFDLAYVGDGAVVNRNAVVETHLFHDRVMQVGPAVLGAGSTLGPATAMLPETELGVGCSVGGRAIVMRGERLPAHTSWHGAPVVAL